MEFDTLSLSVSASVSVSLARRGFVSRAGIHAHQKLAALRGGTRCVRSAAFRSARRVFLP